MNIGGSPKCGLLSDKQKSLNGQSVTVAFFILLEKVHKYYNFSRQGDAE